MNYGFKSVEELNIFLKLDCSDSKLYQKSPHTPKKHLPTKYSYVQANKFHKKATG